MIIKASSIISITFSNLEPGTTILSIPVDKKATILLDGFFFGDAYFFEGEMQSASYTIDELVSNHSIFSNTNNFFKAQKGDFIGSLSQLFPIQKTYHLVFSKSGNFFNVINFINEQMFNENLGFANPVKAKDMFDFITERSNEINSINDVIIISNVIKQDIIETFLQKEFIEISNQFGITTRRHMLPFIIGCSFDINTLSNACKLQCNIIEVL